MNAQQARELTTKNLRGPVIAPLLKHVHEHIAAAASQGRSEITHPLHGLKDWPRQDAQDALWAALTEEGYKVKHHPDPDPGHPASGPYTTVAW